MWSYAVIESFRVRSCLRKLLCKTWTAVFFFSLCSSVRCLFVTIILSYGPDCVQLISNFVWYWMLWRKRIGYRSVGWLCPKLRWTCTGDERQGPSSPKVLECGFYDVEEMNRLTQALLVALAAACVEKTSGTFSQRAAVVPDVKKEMLEYLNQQSESYANGGSSSQSVKLAGLANLVSPYTANYVLFSTCCKDQPLIDPVFRAIALLMMICSGLKIWECIAIRCQGTMVLSWRTRWQFWIIVLLDCVHVCLVFSNSHIAMLLCALRI